MIEIVQLAPFHRRRKVDHSPPHLHGGGTMCLLGSFRSLNSIPPSLPLALTPTFHSSLILKIWHGSNSGKP